MLSALAFPSPSVAQLMPDTFVVANNSGDTISSEQTISVKNEQLILEWGLSVMVQNAMSPGDEGSISTSSNGFLNATEIKDNSTSWLNYYKDNDDFFDAGTNGIFADPGNWIRSGNDPIDHVNIDDGQTYENILAGSWAPYRLVGVDGQGAAAFEHSPAWNQFQSISPLRDVPSVDIVFTDESTGAQQVFSILTLTNDVAILELVQTCRGKGVTTKSGVPGKHGIHNKLGEWSGRLGSASRFSGNPK